MRAIASRFWGSELAVDFSTYDGKALAAKSVQDRWFGNECVILCLWMFPIWQSAHTEDHLGDPTIESQILSAVTGSDFQEGSLYRIGERVFNLQRAVLAREGRAGRKSDKLPEFFFTQPLVTEGYDPECIVPGKDGEVISRKGAVVDRTEFEKMKEEYYGLRGWDVATGLQTTAKLRELELQDVAIELESRNLAV
jgi:aldehyde:ferredoxin oxidoreductase